MLLFEDCIILLVDCLFVVVIRIVSLSYRCHDCFVVVVVVSFLCSCCIIVSLIVLLVVVRGLLVVEILLIVVCQPISFPLVGL